MQLEFLSAPEIKRRALSHLKAKRDAQQRTFDPNEILDARYTAWIDKLIAKHRENGLLLTDRQYADRRAKRELRRGDAARYVGPERLEPVRGREVLRPSGQEGTISNVLTRSDGQKVYTFLPNSSIEEAETPIVELVTTDWRLFERIV